MWIPLDDESAVVEERKEEDEETQESNLNNDATNYDVEGDEEETEYEVVKQCSCTVLWTSRYAQIITYILLALLLLASLTAFIVVIKTVLLVYNKSLTFKRSKCTVIGVSHHLLASQCSSCTGSSSSCEDVDYVCALIHVQYVDEEEKLYNASLVDNELLLHTNVSNTIITHFKFTYNRSFT